MFTSFIVWLREYNDEKQQFARSILINGPKKRKKKSVRLEEYIKKVMDEHKEFDTDKEIYTFLRKISYCAKQFLPYLEEQNEEQMHEENEDKENEDDHLENDQ